ncbi:Uncharacterized protein pbN1_04840 [Aromatoleum bremense]|nr:Uncharacterized protein pbN1_04840 [Aromatoleum bremense]
MVGRGGVALGDGVPGVDRMADFAIGLRGVTFAGGAATGAGITDGGITAVGITGAGGAIRRTLRVAGAEGGTWAGAGPPRPDSASSPAAWAPATTASGPQWTDENRFRTVLPPNRGN